MVLQNDTDLISATTSCETLPQVTEVMAKGKCKKRKPNEPSRTSYLFRHLASRGLTFLSIDYILKSIETSTILDVESFAFKPGPDIPSTSVRDHHQIFLLQRNPELQNTTSAITSELRKRREMLKKREQEKMNDAQKEHDESSSDPSD